MNLSAEVDRALATMAKSPSKLPKEIFGGCLLDTSASLGLFDANARLARRNGWGLRERVCYGCRRPYEVVDQRTRNCPACIAARKAGAR